MKLKVVVASMTVLGLVCSPVFAASKSKHKRMKHRMAYKDEYKDVPVCTISPTSLTMVEMTQNVGRSLPNPCNPGWYDRIRVSGGVNVDVGKWGARNANYMGENYQRVSLNDAYLNVAADASDWAHVFASLSYDTATINTNPGAFNNKGQSEYSAAYSNNINGNSGQSVSLEQGYATIGNFDVSPMFLQVGKQFQDFSRYEIHPITRTLNQVLSETLATSIKLGFISDGFHGSVYAFDDPLTKSAGGSNTTTNYGATVGYDQPGDQFGWDLGVGYLYNMIGVNDVAYMVNNYRSSTNDYTRRVGAWNIYGDINSGPFTLGARYTAALDNFNPNDMPKNGNADLTAGSAVIGSGTNVTVATTAQGAKPWAFDIKAGYGFEGMGKNQNVYLGYQASNEAGGLNIPKYRWMVGYGIDMWKNVNLGGEWDYDSAYSVAKGGTNNNTNLVSLRAAVKFS
jgi:hypothetical protein